MKKNSFQINYNSFRFKIAFYYFIASLLILSLFGGVIYLVVSHIFMNESVSKTQMAIDVSAHTVSEMLSYKKNVLKRYAANETLLSFAKGNFPLQNQIQNHIEEIQASDIYIQSVFVSLHDGTSFSSRPKQELLDSPCPLNQTPPITLTTPIFDEQNVPLGTLGIRLDPCIFSYTLQNLDLGEKSLVVISDENDNLIFSSNPNSPQNQMMFENGFHPDSHTLIYQTKIPNTPWKMASMIHLHSLEVLKRQLFDIVLFSVLLLSGVLILITYLVSQKLTDPLSRLVTGMEDIQNLQELSIQKQEHSETVILTNSYNRMIQKVKTLMEELEQKQEALRSAEFDALTSQINPHFLYNTLDTIVWLAEFRDNEKIISLTKSLAAFFRLSLNGGKSVVPLEDELEHVRQYLMIQQERYADKFDYSFSVAADTLPFIVPKIILQPIVENAIYHGIKPMQGKGTIEIKAEMQAPFVVLTVSDNGVGFSAEQAKTSIQKPTSGVGLKNVEKRIQLFYGKNSYLKVQSDIKGSTVTLFLENI